MPAGSITTWDDLARKFLAKYFPPAKTARMRNDILSFVQYDSESLYDTWERYKDLLRKCPHHNIPQWLQVQTFYNGLTNSLRSTIDAAAGGALMNKGIDEAYNLLEEMAANNYQWNTEQIAPRRVAGIHEVDAISALSAQLAALTKQLGEVKAFASSSASPSCNNCGAAHPTERCTIYTEEVQYVGSYQQNNPYSSTYNLGWRNHPDFSWSNNQNTQQMEARPEFSPSFSQPRQQQEKKPALEDLMAQLIQIQTANEQTQTAAIKNLEMQMGQMANAVAQAHRQPGILPSNTEPNPSREEREHCNAVTLRSGTMLNGPQQPSPEIHEPEPTSQIQSTPAYQKEPESTEPPKEPTFTEPSTSTHMPQAQPCQQNNPPPTQRPTYPPPPFPQRLQKQRTDAQFSKFLEVLKQLHINIPFAEAFEQMPKYAKYMKELLTHKRRGEDHETEALTEECSAVLLKKLPPKLKDPLLAVLVDGYTSDEEEVATYDHQPKLDDMKWNTRTSAKSYKRKRWRAKKITKEHVEPGHQVLLDRSVLNLFPGRLKGE